MGVHDIITALVGYKHHESISTSQFLPRDAMQNVVLPSRLSVTLRYCGHIGWNTSKIMSWLISLRCSLSADPNMAHKGESYFWGSGIYINYCIYLFIVSSVRSNYRYNFKICLPTKRSVWYWIVTSSS